MNLARELFWDVNYDTINWKKNYQWVICRVLERGGMKDWYEIKKHYGIENIIESAKNAKYLSKKTTHFIHNIFNIPLEEFKCYRLMQSHPEQWIY